MTKSRVSIYLLAALIALAPLAACGDDDDSDPAAAASEAVDDATDDESEDEASSSDEESDDEESSDDEGSDDGASAAALEDILDADYVEGSAHVEVSGDADVTEDYTTGGGFSSQGTTSLSFTNDAGLLGVAIDAGSGGGISFTSDDFATGGTFPDQCRLSVTQNDESGFAGEFTCEGVPAVNGSSTDLMTVDVEGTFSVSP